MVVFEVKDVGTLSQPKTPKPIRREISPAAPVFELKAIGQLFGEQQQGEPKKRKRQPVGLTAAGVKDVQRLAAEVNLHLERSGAQIHLMLIQEGDGFVLDVYDCSDGHACQVVHDMTISLEKLPELLAKLQQESGIIFDEVM